ncbi:S-methyl-5-thioribose-1-phosphate isomerase, partial [Erwinia amylovora]|nr:S-methyl-5-thioribose-1-phosphate isomerase [Erwinia amylovora]
MLDHKALPQHKIWCQTADVNALVCHIKALRVRGAPLIFLSASLLLALLAEIGMAQAALAEALDLLRAASPTSFNLMNNLEIMKQALARNDF